MITVLSLLCALVALGMGIVFAGKAVTKDNWYYMIPLMFFLFMVAGSLFTHPGDGVTRGAGILGALGLMTFALKKWGDGFLRPAAIVIMAGLAIYLMGSAGHASGSGNPGSQAPMNRFDPANAGSSNAAQGSRGRSEKPQKQSDKAFCESLPLMFRDTPRCRK